MVAPYRRSEAKILKRTWEVKTYIYIIMMVDKNFENKIPLFVEKDGVDFHPRALMAKTAPTGVKIITTITKTSVDTKINE